MTREDFFESLDEMLKKQIKKGANLEPEKEKSAILHEIAKYACQILQYRGVMYQVQLPTNDEVNRCLYFSGIENILSILYVNFNSLSKKEKVHIYEKNLPSPKSIIEKDEALKKVQENLGLLQTQWLNYYKKG